MESKQEIIIIGGGIIGLACAHYLSENNISVTVIDQGEIGSGASHGNCGLLHSCGIAPLCAPGVIAKEMFRVFSKSSPLYIRPTLDPAILSWLLKFALNCNSKHLLYASGPREAIIKHSMSLFSQLFATETLECEFDDKGLLIVFKDKKPFDAYEKKNEWLKQFGMDGKRYSTEEMLTLEPCLKDDLAGAWLVEHDSHLKPDLLVKSWRKRLTKNGVRFIEHARMTDVRVNDRKLTQVITPKGHFSADTFVLATGAWSGQAASLLKMKIPVQPGKGYSITMQRPDPCPSIPCLLSERNMVVTPWPSGYRLGGTMEFSGFNRELNMTRLNQLRDGAKAYLSIPPGQPVIEEWNGFRPMTSDDLPIIDQSPDLKNLYIATGHGMFGLTMATGTGKIISDMILGNRPGIDITAFSLKRF